MASFSDNLLCRAGVPDQTAPRAFTAPVRLNGLIQGPVRPIAYLHHKMNFSSFVVCRKAGDPLHPGALAGTGQPGSPWENGYCESFNGKLRDECLNGEIFYSLKEAQIIIESWRKHYNTVRPHSALSYRPPAPLSRIVAA